MALTASLADAIVKAEALQDSEKLVVKDIADIAGEVNITEAHIQQDPPTDPPTAPTFDVRVIVSFRSTGVQKALAEQIAELFALSTGTR